MKKIYEVSLTSPNGGQIYYAFNIANIVSVSHEEDNGVNGTTKIVSEGAQFTFNGKGNKLIYDDIVKLLRELE